MSWVTKTHSLKEALPARTLDPQPRTANFRLGVATRSVQSVLREFSAQERNHQSSFSDFWGKLHSKQLWWQLQFPGKGAQAAQPHGSSPLSKESKYRRRQVKCQMAVEKINSTHHADIARKHLPFSQGSQSLSKASSFARRRWPKNRPCPSPPRRKKGLKSARIASVDWVLKDFLDDWYAVSGFLLGWSTFCNK